MNPHKKLCEIWGIIDTHRSIRCKLSAKLPPTVQVFSISLMILAATGQVFGISQVILGTVVTHRLMILMSSKRVTVNQMKQKLLVLQGNRFKYMSNTSWAVRLF